MAELGPQVPNIPAPAHPQPPPALQALQQPAQPPQQGQQIIHINWSHFKPEFSGKPEEDAEAHLLRANDWMNAHHFVEGIIVQRFHLTLLGEARLFLSVFRTYKCRLARFTKFVYTAILKTRQHKGTTVSCIEIFHFDKNTETIDAYVTCIRQVATLLGYEEPQILDIFKNILPTKLY